jgi:hypothetical protein
MEATFNYDCSKYTIKDIEKYLKEKELLDVEYENIISDEVIYSAVKKWGCKISWYDIYIYIPKKAWYWDNYDAWIKWDNYLWNMDTKIFLLEEEWKLKESEELEKQRQERLEKNRKLYTKLRRKFWLPRDEKACSCIWEVYEDPRDKWFFWKLLGR